MNFSRLFFFIFACIMALTAVSAAPEPRWEPFEKLERICQHVRDGIKIACPAVTAVSAVPEARWEPFEKLERICRYIRDGVFIACPLTLDGQTNSINKGKSIQSPTDQGSYFNA